MAFWGIEVKPGKPFTHSFDQVRGRLRISQATLGIGSSTKKSLVQCNVGDKSPVFLCALLPDKTESCHLDLEFEEGDDVIFSVIGPRSIYLTGYYLGGGRHSYLNNDSDSYGEDIANTETDESTHCTDEDEYEDSFIDDGKADVSPTSSVSKEKVDEEMLDNKKSKERKGGRKRLKKKYQSIESDDDNNSQTQDIVNERKGVSGLESEDEDNFPISSLGKSSTADAEENFDRETRKIGNKKTYDDDSHARTQDNGTCIIDPKSRADAEPERRHDQPNHSLLPSDEVGSERHTKSKKKRKRTKEGNTLESGDIDKSNDLKDHKTLQDKALDQKPVTNKETDWLLPSTEAGSENPKKRRKECEKAVEGSANCNNVLKADKVAQNEVGTGKNAKNHPARIEQDQFSNTNRRDIDIDSNQVAGGDQPEDKKSKKKKKKSKSHENEGNTDIYVPSLPLEERNGSVKGFEEKNVEHKPSQGRTLSNGLIVEDLDMGEPGGKIAAPEKKIKVHYIGKLKENGQIFDSNMGKSPFRFRLGDEDVIEGWNAGLNGMRVGGKRRLIIPPSMGYGSQGAGENIPPNSWLVYEVELLSVR